MKLEQILVYDKQHYFSRFLKYKFNEIFDFKKYKNDEDLNDMEEKFLTIVFVIYSESDLLDFVKVYGKGPQILVCSYNKEILRKMKNINDIILLDISKTKLEMEKELLTVFNCIIPQYKEI